MYKLYQGKNSLRRTRSRLLQGGNTEIGDSKLKWWERKNIKGLDSQETPYVITAKTVGRPDLIAAEVYGSTELEWIVLQYNNIVDVIEELVVGKQLVLPSLSFVNISIITKPAGGFLS